MSHVSELYRMRLIAVVSGARPSIANVADETALARFCAILADSEEAKKLLCTKGYGLPSQSLLDLVRALPDKAIA